MLFTKAMVHVSIRTAVVAGLLACVTLGAAPAPAPTGVAPAGVATRDFRIETDQTNSNLNDGNFTMPHRVKFFRPGTDAVGDRAKGNYKAGTVTISGHVVLHDNGESAEGQAAARQRCAATNCKSIPSAKSISQPGMWCTFRVRGARRPTAAGSIRARIRSI